MVTGMGGGGFLGRYTSPRLLSPALFASQLVSAVLPWSCWPRLLLLVSGGYRSPPGTSPSFLSGLEVSWMVLPIRYRVPYEATMVATDIGSGKVITNRLYVRCGIQTAFPPAYGAAIAGPSDVAIWALAVSNGWMQIGGLGTLCNANYTYSYTVCRAIMGMAFNTVTKGIAALFPGTPTVIATGVPHGLTTGKVINIVGVTTPFGINGVWVVTVLSPTTLSLNGSSTLAGWSLDGVWQLATGRKDFYYEDTVTDNSQAGQVGHVVGDAMPLFTGASIRRHSSGIGRYYKSRISLAPLSESDNLDGKIEPLRVAALDAAAAVSGGPVNNGGSDAGSGVMNAIVVSPGLARGVASPFVSSDPFCSEVTLWECRPNFGSMIRRKPKLGAAIT